VNQLPKLKAFKVEEVKAKNPGAKRVKIIYGPYRLQAANSTVKLGNGKSMDKGGTSYENLVDDDFPKDITVLEAWSMVTDENLKRAETKDGIYNHHNVFMELTKNPPVVYSCESGSATTRQTPAVFNAGATEVGEILYSSSSKDIKTGYYLSKDRRMINMIDTINYNDFEKTVYTYSEIEYLPGRPAGYIDTCENVSLDLFHC
jgi:hypothetical protein